LPDDAAVLLLPACSFNTNRHTQTAFSTAT